MLYSAAIEENYYWKHARNAQNVLGCYRNEFAPVSPLYVERKEKSYALKTFTKGDHVSAFPYEGIFYEEAPFEGRLTSEVFRSDYPGYSCGEKSGQTTVWSGDLGCFFDASVPVDPPRDDAIQRRLKAIADTKALADLARSYVNVPLILAERRETIAMIRAKASILANGVGARQRADLRRWHKTRKADKRRVARDIANEHLAYLFGVLPLVEEIKGLCGKLTAEDSFVLTGRGRAADVSTDNSLSYTGTGKSTGVRYTPSCRVEGVKTTRFSHRTSISVVVDVEAFQSLRDWGFNPIAVVYDLVPLSFLSDFVSNLGTFLRAYDPLLGVTFRNGSSTSWAESKQTVNVIGITSVRPRRGGNFDRCSTSGAGTSSSRSLRVRRTVLTDYPSPSFELSNNLSLSKVATLSSLAVQRYLKPVRALIKQKPFRYKGPRPKWLPPIKYTGK